MKSRLAVSLLYILIASSFVPDATADLKKLRSWTGKVCAAAPYRSAMASPPPATPH